MKDILEVDMPEYFVSDDEIKSDYILYTLSDYGVEDERDAIRIIEKQGIDKFNFDYPYGSFEEYKNHVLAGEFDVDVKSRIETPEGVTENNKAVREGRLWVKY